MDLPTLSTGSVVEDFVGVPFADDPARWALASPMTHVTADDPPFLFVHAEHDLIVQVEQSEQMLATLRAAGVAADFLELEGNGHLFGEGAGLGEESYQSPFDTAESTMAVFDFLERTVGAPMPTEGCCSSSGQQPTNTVRRRRSRRRKPGSNGRLPPTTWLGAVYLSSLRCL